MDFTKEMLHARAATNILKGDGAPEAWYYLLGNGLGPGEHHSLYRQIKRQAGKFHWDLLWARAPFGIEKRHHPELF